MSRLERPNACYRQRCRHLLLPARQHARRDLSVGVTVVDVGEMFVVVGEDQMTMLAP